MDLSCGRFRMTGNSAARGPFPVMVKRPHNNERGCHCFFYIHTQYLTQIQPVSFRPLTALPVFINGTLLLNPQTHQSSLQLSTPGPKDDPFTSKGIFDCRIAGCTFIGFSKQAVGIHFKRAHGNKGLLEVRSAALIEPADF